MGKLNEQKIAELRGKKESYKLGGGLDAIEKQHNRGKLTARERLDLLFDKGTFVEYGIFAKPDTHLFDLDKKYAPADGVVTGFGKVNGRLVWAISQDFTVLGGTMGQNHSRKINRASDEAARNGCPCVYLWDCGGGRIQEAWFDQVHKVTMLISKNSGYVPSVSVIMGACAGGSVYAPMLSDFIISVDKTSKFYICGPSVIKSATGEEVDDEVLAGAWTNNKISGNAHQWAANDEDAIQHVKKYLSYMPQNCNEKVPSVPYNDDPDRLVPELNAIIPDSKNRVFDVHRVIELIADQDSVYEYQPYWAENIVCCFARIMGETVGLIANNTTCKAGCFDIDASDKFARFVDIIDCYNIPMITLTDTPGFFPGIQQEHGGIIRHGAACLEAAYRATVPKIQVVLRKQYGGAGLPMGFTLFALDMNLYWPTFDYGIFDAKAACEIILNKDIKANPDKKEEILAAGVKAFEDARTPYAMCEHMWADDIIEPSQTRMYLIKGLELLRNKNPELIQVPNRRKKHSVSPR